ncbi:AIPR family protein [Hymenobacter sp. B1770]|uniref:AIPR family protein n=1 Tax=Hymenobacter sp. B1770 TaxID=1718788 RepID=UPI003CF0D3B2
MSLFKIVENNLSKLIANRPEIFEAYSQESHKMGIAFMLYSLGNIFRNIEAQDLEEGIVDCLFRGEKHDYGIDAIYLTANGEIVNSKDELHGYNRDTRFVFHFLQFKKGSGIEQSDLLKFNEGLKRVFLNEDLEEDQNEFLHAKMELLNGIKTSIYENDNFRTDQISVKLYLVFNGMESNVTENFLLNSQIAAIKKELVDGGYVNNSIEIVDAQKNLNLSKNSEEIVGRVKYQKTLKYITEAGDNKLNGYVSIVKAREIAQLVKKWQGELFEANIRDYYKRNDLNSKILDTSSDEHEAKYFWSFNNGLTITCRLVEELPNDAFRLHGIQIVNGCQTSNALYIALYNLERYQELEQRQKASEKLSQSDLKFLNSPENKCLNDEATVLVKIIETNDPELTYRITETTNSQTPIKAFSLKANDNIQQNIERFLEQEGIYYERRINFYKNQGIKNIVTIQQLFQLFTSQISFKPSAAKNALKVTFTNTYDKVFPSVDDAKQNNYSVYLVPILIDQAIEEQIRIFLKADKIEPFNKVLLSYGRLHLGPLVLNEILGAYTQKDVVAGVDKVKAAIKDQKQFGITFFKALLSLRTLVQSVSGTRPQSIATGLRKVELDEKIVRFISAKRIPTHTV